MLRNRQRYGYFSGQKVVCGRYFIISTESSYDIEIVVVVVFFNIIVNIICGETLTDLLRPKDD